MKRLFVGSFVNDSTFYKNYSKIKKDFSNSLPGKWIPKENLHITYKFLGNIEEEKIDPIKESLFDILNKDISINLIMKGISAFPNLENPKVVYIQVRDKDKILENIYKKVEEKLSKFNFPQERKPFIPHITVKRPKQVKKEEFLEKVKSYENKILANLNNIEVNLIESILSPKGATYKKI